MVYVSSATALFSPSTLDDILRTSVVNNGASGVSGLLLYKDGNLMQVLEGEEETVRGLYRTIARDPRHSGLISIWDGYSETRQFSGWSMAFRDLSGSAGLSTPGYSDFLNTPLTGAEFAGDPTLCQQLLTMFKSSM